MMISRSTRSSTRRRDPDPLAALLAERVELDRVVIALDPRTWALHGFIAYDGKVIAATYASEHEARVALSRLDDLERGVRS